jgi:hypothetical protein
MSLCALDKRDYENSKSVSALRSHGGNMPAQQHYNSLDSKQRQELLLKIGETREEAQLLSQRDYVGLGGWVKARLKRHLKHHKA